MSDTFQNLFGKGFFFAGKDDENVPQALRQKIALAMLLKKGAIPKNIGEGLFSIGDSFGDALAARAAYRDAASAEEYAKGAEGRIAGATMRGEDEGAESAPIVTPAPPVAPGPYGRAVGGDIPVDGTEGNTGATTFLPPVQPPPPPIVPPIARSATAPTTPPIPATTPAPPLPPLPPDQQQQPGNEFNDRFGASFPSRRSALPGAPVMARGGDEPEPAQTSPRDMIAGALTPRPAGLQQVAQAAPPPAAPTIRAAPPPQPPAPPAPPAPSAPEPGYVTPLPPPLKPPPTMTPIMQNIQQTIRETPAAYRDSVKARLAPLYEAEQAKVTQQHEMFKDEMTQRRALEIKHHEQKAAARASVDAARAAELAAEKAQQDIAKGKIPEVKQEVETGFIYNPETREWEQPRIAGTGPDTKPVFKGNEFQGKALVNYGRAKIAHEGLRGPVEEALSSSPLQSALSSAPFGVARPLRSGAYKEAETHADNFVQAFIRQQSGAPTPTPNWKKKLARCCQNLAIQKNNCRTNASSANSFSAACTALLAPAGRRASTSMPRGGRPGEISLWRIRFTSLPMRPKWQRQT